MTRKEFLASLNEEQLKYARLLIRQLRTEKLKARATPPVFAGKRLDPNTDIHTLVRCGADIVQVIDYHAGTCVRTIIAEDDIRSEWWALREIAKDVKYGLIIAESPFDGVVISIGNYDEGDFATRGRTGGYS